MSVSAGVAVARLVFQRPLLFGTVDLAQVVDAGVLLRRRAGAHEVGDRDRGNRPMMATTIMISTSVKPDLRMVFFFMLIRVFLLARELGDQRVVYYYYELAFTDC